MSRRSITTLANLLEKHTLRALYKEWELPTDGNALLDKVGLWQGESVLSCLVLLCALRTANVSNQVVSRRACKSRHDHT